MATGAVQWPPQTGAFPNYPALIPGAAANPFIETPEKWYQDECKKLDIQNMALRRTIDSLAEECSTLKTKLQEFDNPDPDSNLRKNLKKRRRRVATEIPRHFRCDICAKAYG